MFSKMKIKTQIIVSTAFILGIIVLMQIFLYSILQKENKNIISSIFNSITQNSVQQINKLNEDIAESSSLLAVHKFVQEGLYEYTPVEIVKNAENIQNLLSDYLDSNQNIAFWGIVKNRKLFMSADRVDLYLNVRQIISELKFPENFQQIYLSSFVNKKKMYFTCVTPVFPTNISHFTAENEENFIICIYEMGSISYVPSGVIDDEAINLIITDNENKIILSTDHTDHGKLFNSNQINNSYLYKTIPLSEPDWSVTTYMQSGHISIFSNLILFFIAFMIVLTIAMLVLMLKLLNNIIVKRIDILNQNVSKISEKDTTYRIKYTYNDEFTGLVATVNRVLDTVHTLNSEKLNTLGALYDAQLLQKETQIFYLYGQVSPHFLYNSLSHIQGLAFYYDVPEISDMVEALSKVFRYFSNNNNLSNIKQDLDCAIEYFNVINMRRTNPLMLINNVNPDIYGVPCLKMIYQPILENTIKHAFSFNDSGTVTISSIQDETKAIIEIKDNGHGIAKEKLEEIKLQMSEKKLSEIHMGEHIGLVNVNMRLKLYYNNDCGIKVFSEKDKGTTVHITFEKEIKNKENEAITKQTHIF